METRRDNQDVAERRPRTPAGGFVATPTAVMVMVTLVVIALLVSCSAAETPRAERSSPLVPVPVSEPATDAAEPAPEGGAIPTPAPRGEIPAPTEECPEDNEKRGWYYTPASAAGAVPRIPADVASMLESYGGLWRAETSAKVVYLTLDEGYEAGYTAQILDVLSKEKVPAAFFVTRSYVEKNPDLVRRMAREGHVVANHSDTHPSMPALADDPARFEAEFARCADEYRAVTGEQMSRFFRPPMGEYSARTLCMTERLGYTSVMWSFAHRDWLTDDQPPVSVTIDRVVGGTHPGAILLVHAVSSSNTEALPEIIRRLRADGYRFGSLDELTD